MGENSCNIMNELFLMKTRFWENHVILFPNVYPAFTGPILLTHEQIFPQVSGPLLRLILQHIGTALVLLTGYVIGVETVPEVMVLTSRLLISFLMSAPSPSRLTEHIIVVSFSAENSV